MTDETTDDALAIVEKHAPDAPEGEGRAPSLATQLVTLARERYTFGQSAEGDTFAVPLDGPPVVRTLRGGRSSLRAELAREFFEQKDKVPPASALADACAVLDGYAAQLDPTDLALRVARDGERRVLDLGDATGRAVVIDAHGWRIEDAPPVHFRRTALTGPLPEPERGGSLDALWSLVNVAPRYRPILAAFLVAALTPDIPHPVLALTGEQGSGKSSATRMISATLDPSPAQLRKPPRDLDTWTTAAAGSQVVAIDNLSAVPPTISDAFCRASTGDGDVRRALYTDGDLHVVAFRRVVVLNGIDLGGIADDLADRLVTVHLDRIAEGGHRQDAEVAAAWEQAHPKVLGAVLDLAAQVLATMPSVRPESLPRMADFGLILATVDHLLGTDGLDVYRGLRSELAEDALASDSALAALVRLLPERQVDTWTAAALLDVLNPVVPSPRPSDWPTSAREVTALVSRRSPTLRRLGWSVEDAGKHSRTRARQWRITPPATTPDASRGGSGARDARNARTEDVSAGQTASEGASDVRATTTTDARTRSQVPVSLAVSNAKCERREQGASDDRADARTSRSHPRGPVTSENAPTASGASGASADPAPARESDVWRRSGEEVRSA